MSLNVANCDRCGKVYAKNPYGMCPACVKEVDQQLDKCYKYLREFKQCSLEEMSEATEVPIKQITKFIREGKLSIKGNPNVSYGCEICQSPIRTSNLCDACRKRLTSQKDNMEHNERLRIEQQGVRERQSFHIGDRLRER